MNNLVDSEDIRLRTTFAKFGILKTPTMLPPQAGSLPTLLLPARARPYTADDLVTAKAMAREVDGTSLLVTSVVVGPNAKLNIDSGVGALKLQSGKAGFATLTSWRGAIDIVGQSGKPLTVEGWDTDQLKPDTVEADGRAYLRTMGGELVLRNVHASDLGFWSGRTGGVSWTGSKGEPSTGGAATSTIDNSAYGLYISGSQGVQIIGCKLTANEHDGLAIHRDGLTTLVTNTTAYRNSGEGFVIDRAAGSRIMRSQSIQNAGDGIVLDGRGIGVVATASGVQINQAKGSVIDSNTVSDNGRYGIRVLGGLDTLVHNNTVSGKGVGIVVKSGSNGTQLIGNKVSGSAETGVQIGPDAKRTAITANTIAGSATGIRTQDATANIISKNIVTGATDFAVTAHGVADGSLIRNNRLSGEGWRAVDVRHATGLIGRSVGANNASGWVTRKVTRWYALFERHPALIVWIVVLILPFVGWWSRRRRRNLPASHPYPESAMLLRRKREVVPLERLVNGQPYPAETSREPALAGAPTSALAPPPPVVAPAAAGGRREYDDLGDVDPRQGGADRLAGFERQGYQSADYRSADADGDDDDYTYDDWPAHTQDADDPAGDEDTQTRPAFTPRNRGWHEYGDAYPADDRDGYDTYQQDDDPVDRAPDHDDQARAPRFDRVDLPWNADEHLASQVPSQSNGHANGRGGLPPRWRRDD